MSDNNNRMQEIAGMLEGEVYTMDGFDCAFIGIEWTAGVLAYSLGKIVKKLVSDGMSTSDALEFYNFNIEGSCHGEGMPIVIDDYYF